MAIFISINYSKKYNFINYYKITSTIGISGFLELLLILFLFSEKLRISQNCSINKKDSAQQNEHIFS